VPRRPRHERKTIIDRELGARARRVGMRSRGGRPAARAVR
jgi:hypothetical protein